METTNTVPESNLPADIIEELVKVGHQLFVNEELVIDKEVSLEIKSTILNIIDKITFKKIQSIKKFQETIERFRKRIEKIKQKKLEETAVVKRFMAKNNLEKLTNEQVKIIEDAYEQARDNRIDAVLASNLVF